MIKLRQYYVFKLETSRIKESNYNINLSVNQARLNGELVQIGDNQVFRLIRKFRNQETDYNLLDNLFKERDKIKKLHSSEENARLIQEYQKQIDDILFVPDIVNVKVDDKKVYKEIFKNKFKVNGITFERLCSGAGQSRRSTATFANVEIIDKLKEYLNCGAKIDEIDIAKYNAYFGLYMSATYPVRTPRVCVIDDCETDKYKIKETVDWIEDKDILDNDGNVIGSDRKIYKKDDFEFIPNMFDGQGLISPSFAKKWQKDLELDYLPSSFVIRSSFIKGNVVVFPFHEFAEKVAKTNKIKDIYNKEWDVNEIDLLISKSQFKMNKFYSSWDEFLKYQKQYGLTWGVTKVNAKYDNEMSLLNYQYIQCLDLDKQKLQQLYKPTVNWIKKVCNGDKLYTSLFLLGLSKEYDTVKKIFDKADSNFVKAFLYNDKLLQDSYIKKKIYNTISTKIDEAKIGRLWVRGNYQFMISDPYAQAQFAFSKKVTGLLKKGEYYSNFWNKRKVKTVDACRSPMVDFHEHNIINFVDNEEINKWYRYINSGIIYNVWGTDTIRHSDSDWDGDIVFTTDNEIILNSVIPNLNVITYEKSSATPKKLNNTNILKTDLRSFNSKIGVITNYSTSFISMLANFEKDSDEYKELLKRIKLLRRYIGDSIDEAKGIKTKPFPSHWKSWQKIYENDSEEIKKKKQFNNKLVAKKKPYFMIYIYDKLKREFYEYKHSKDRVCKERFGCSLNQLIKKRNKTKEESNFIYLYFKKMPVIKNNSIMNILCGMIESIDFDLIKPKNDENSQEMFAILTDSGFIPDEEKLSKLLEVRKKFNRILNNKYKYKNVEVELNYSNNSLDKTEQIDEFYKEIRNEVNCIISNSRELANYLVYIDYIIYPKQNKDFAWHIGIEGILEILKSKFDGKIELPIKDENGEEYLGERYSLRKVVI